MIYVSLAEQLRDRLLCLLRFHQWHAYTKAGHRWRFCRRLECGYFDCRRSSV